MRFRLIERDDAVLAVGLIAAAVLVFQQPLRDLWDVVREIEARYRVDLLPGLTILIAVVVFHEYRKREAWNALHATANAEAAQARRRAEDLERLMTLGHALANTLDRSTLLHALWRHVPAFAHDREFWAMLKTGERWVPLVQGASTFNSRSVDVLRTIAERTLCSQSALDGSAEGIPDEEDICFPMVATDTVVGVLGIRNRPPLSQDDRRMLGAAAAVIAIGVTNVQLFRETREMSLRDSLTGCFNRGHALEMLDSELRRAKRSGNPLSIVMFDIDHFKTINDRLGHVRGDELLHNVGALLARVLRNSDLRCRYGGDEFLVMLPDTPLIGGEQVAECLRREIATLEVAAGGKRISVTASIGVAAAIPGDINVTNFVDRVDSALYEAKRLGRNRFCVAPGRSGSAGREAQVVNLPHRVDMDSSMNG
jgi:diguanylate cyclase (GGDEF)-like protein